MANWLLKTEPDVFSIDDLATAGAKGEPWNGIRNYQARNMMRDEMKIGDLVLYYHSSCELPGVVGIARVASEPYPDPTQFDRNSEYYDESAAEDNPRWILVDFEFVAEFPREVSLTAMKGDAGLGGMLVLRKGNRLSVMPVEGKHFRRVCKLGGWNPKGA